MSDKRYRYIHMSGRRYNGFYFPENYIAGARRPERTAIHRIDIYSYDNFFWHRRNDRYLVPGGILHKTISIDFGLILPHVEELAEVEEQNYRRRNRVEETLRGGKKVKLPKSWKYVEDYINPSFEVQPEDGSIFYAFDVRLPRGILKQPLEYHVTRILSQDKKVEDTWTEKATIWATRQRGSKNVPLGDYVIRYNRELKDLQWN